MSPSLTLCYDMWNKELDFKLAARLFAQLKQVQPNYLGDFYPLTAYSLSNNVWLAWHYNRPEAGAAVVLGIVTLFFMADRPRDATWLSVAEREYLEGVLAAEAPVRPTGPLPVPFGPCCIDPAIDELGCASYPPCEGPWRAVV